MAPSLPVKTSHAATAVLGEKMFVFGGSSQADCEAVRPQVQILSSRPGLSWSLSPATEPPRALGSHNCALSLPPLVLLIGGWTEARCEGRPDSLANYLDQVYILDTTTATWTEGPRLNTRRRDHGCTVVSVAGRLVRETELARSQN